MSDSSLLALAVTGRGLVDPGEPVLRADDEGFTRGAPRSRRRGSTAGAPFRLAEHIARLERSAARIGLPPPDPSELGAPGGARARPRRRP